MQIKRDFWSGDSWTSLGKENRINFVGGLQLDGYGEMSYQVVEGDSTDRDE